MTRSTRGPALMKEGFTLIEVVIYIALLSLIIGGSLAAAYELLQGQQRAGGHDTVEAEGSFVLSKFNAAMGTITATSTPSRTSPYTADLDITLAAGRYQMCLASGIVYVRRGGSGGVCGDSSYDALTTTNVAVSALHFGYLPAAGSAPDGLQASTTINGITFSATRYIRK